MKNIFNIFQKYIIFFFNFEDIYKDLLPLLYNK